MNIQGVNVEVVSWGYFVNQLLYVELKDQCFNQEILHIEKAKDITKQCKYKEMNKLMAKSVHVPHMRCFNESH